MMDNFDVDIARQRISSFMNGREVTGYIEGDLKKLLKIKPESDGTGGLAVPLGLTCFAIMDLFGFLTNPDEKADPAKTKSNIIYFVTKYFVNVHKKYRQALAGFLHKLFRNGLAHQFFPKACAIRRESKSNIILEWLGEKKIWCLNVDPLAHAVLLGLEEIRQKLNDDELVITINRRLNDLQELDSEVFGKITQEQQALLLELQKKC